MEKLQKKDRKRSIKIKRRNLEQEMEKLRKIQEN